ncbi:MAG: relaxase/mobilization nuclease domain-containing protein [Oleispira sp.]|nr:relaxase/mobilization nuclease domain-containing protein [Oleispira sp.]
MIVKLQTISHTANALAYCEKGGDIIATHMCLGDSTSINKQMKKHNSINDRCYKNTFHIKIRIAPEDKGKLSIQDWIDISNGYAKKIGFNKNPYAVYIHEENTEQEHVHLLVSRILPNGLATNDSFTHLKSMDYARYLEEKYTLRKVERKLEKLQKNEIFIASDKRHAILKLTIGKAIEFSDNFEDFKFYLKNEGIKVKEGRGIGFTDAKGVYFKGSAIDRKFSLKGIKNAIEGQHQINKQKRKRNNLGL